LSNSEVFMLICTIIAICIMVFGFIKKYRFRTFIYIMVAHSLVMFLTKVLVQEEAVFSAFLGSFGIIQLILFIIFLILDFQQVNGKTR